MQNLYIYFSLCSVLKNSHLCFCFLSNHLNNFTCLRKKPPKAIRHNRRSINFFNILKILGKEPDFSKVPGCTPKNLRKKIFFTTRILIKFCT